VARRPPKMMALMGTPLGDSQSGSIVGHCEAGAVKREFGCAAFAPGFRTDPRSPRASLPVEAFLGRVVGHAFPPDPRSRVRATLVKMVFFASVFMALGLVLADVPGLRRRTPLQG